jgi:two-component system response regulator
VDPGQSCVVVLVEDNPDHGELIKICLLQHTAVSRVVHLKDGDEAINFVLQFASSDVESTSLPDLMLLDLKLAKGSATDVLCTIRKSEEWKKIPVVILTSSEADRDVREAYQSGANGYTVKPLDFGSLQQLISDICSFWLVWNHIDSPPVSVQQKSDTNGLSVKTIHSV